MVYYHHSTVAYYTNWLRFDIKASTIMFCCIMLSAMLVLVRLGGGHMSVGPKTMARLLTAIRLTSLKVVTRSRCCSRTSRVAWCGPANRLIISYEI